MRNDPGACSCARIAMDALDTRTLIGTPTLALGPLGPGAGAEGLAEWPVSGPSSMWETDLEPGRW
jgi:hypothetical protein